MLTLTVFNEMSSKQNYHELPSMYDGFPWIWATPNNESRVRVRKSDYILKGMRIEGNEGIIAKQSKDGLTAERFPLSEESIDKIARNADIRSGKWLIFRDRSMIDSIWNDIAQETIDGNLGVAAKVSTLFQEKQKHVICVYTDDYFDSDDVMRVREKLSNLGIEDLLYYKPDIYTRLGIYSGTCTIRPWKYKM